MVLLNIRKPFVAETACFLDENEKKMKKKNSISAENENG